MEIVFAEAKQFDFGLGNGLGRAGFAVNESHFANRFSRAAGGEHLGNAVGADSFDTNSARDDHI